MVLGVVACVSSTAPDVSVQFEVLGRDPKLRPDTVLAVVADTLGVRVDGVVSHAFRCDQLKAELSPSPRPVLLRVFGVRIDLNCPDDEAPFLYRAVIAGLSPGRYLIRVEHNATPVFEGEIVVP